MKYVDELCAPCVHDRSVMMRYTTTSISVFCALLLASSVALAAPVEEEAVEAVSLTYTFSRLTSDVMDAIPDRISNTTDYDLRLSAWILPGGQPCPNQNDIYLAIAYGHATVYSLCESPTKYDGDRFRTIPIDMVKNMAPTLAAIMDANWPVFSASAEDGELIGVPGVDERLVLPLYLPVIREDWLEAIGIKLPDAGRVEIDSSGVVSYVDHSFSVDEFRDILARLKEEFMLSPVTGRWDLSFSVLFGAFGLPVIEDSLGMFVTANGVPNTVNSGTTNTVLPNVRTTQFGDLIDELHSWYHEGLFDEESFLGDNYPGNDKLYANALIHRLLAGEAGVVTSLFVLVDWETVIESAKGNLDGGERLAILQPLTGEGGVQGTRRLRWSELNGTFMALAGDATDREAEASLQVLDYIKLTPDGYALAEEGVSGSSDEPPHFPEFPYFVVSQMYPLMYEAWGLELMDILTKSDARKWPLAPVYWFPEDRAMEEIYLRVGEEVNTDIEKAFLAMIQGKYSMHEFQSNELQNDGFMDAWERTKKGVRHSKHEWVRTQEAWEREKQEE